MPSIPNPEPDSARRRICVADDDPVSRAMLGSVLSKWGYEVALGSDGNEAYALLEDPDGPRIALLDWMMPGRDGLSICSRLRSDFPDRNYYLLLVTARAEEGDLIAALRSGADDYVSKPFSPHVLQARLEVGLRTLDMQRRLEDFAVDMQRLAAVRAAQLVHADRMASIGSLAASVAHEINNPASFLSVNVQTLRDSWPSLGKVLAGDAAESDLVRARAVSAEMPAMLAEMEDGLSRIRRITSDLRLFSRSGSGARTPVDLVRSLEKALRMCSIRLGGRVETRMDIPLVLPSVLADETRLEQVFVNLLLNAADAVEDSAERWIAIRARRPGERQVRIQVEDSGPGVPPGLEQSLFQPFFTTKPPGKGTGLGLHISRQLVQEFGGDLTFVRSEGAGACFEVALPVLGEDPP